MPAMTPAEAAAQAIDGWTDRMEDSIAIYFRGEDPKPPSSTRVGFDLGELKQEETQEQEGVVGETEAEDHTQDSVPDLTDTQEASEGTSMPKVQVLRETVSAGASFTKVAHIDQPDSTIVWFFREEYGYDVTFSIIVKHDNEEIILKPSSQCVTNKGAYVCSKPCQVEFVWDNSHSYFFSKYLLYNIDLQLSDGRTVGMIHKE